MTRRKNDALLEYERNLGAPKTMFKHDIKQTSRMFSLL